MCLVVYIGEELASETRVKCHSKIIVSICMVIITAIKTTKNNVVIL